LEHSSISFRKNLNNSTNIIQKLIYSKYLLGNKLRIYNAKEFIKKKFPYVYKSQILLRENNGLSGDYQWLRLYELYNLIIENRISSVLELGSGASTIFFESLNLRRLDTFEESKMWIKRTQSFLKKNNNCELHLSEREVFLEETNWISRYKHPRVDEIYKKFKHKMIYIDGPTAKFLKKDNESIMTINYDAKLIMELDNPPKLIVIDGRPETVAYLANKFFKKYKLILRSSYREWKDRQGKFYYHSILTLN